MNGNTPQVNAFAADGEGDLGVWDAGQHHAAYNPTDPVMTGGAAAQHEPDLTHLDASAISGIGKLPYPSGGMPVDLDSHSEAGVSAASHSEASHDQDQSFSDSASDAGWQAEAEAKAKAQAIAADEEDYGPAANRPSFKLKGIADLYKGEQLDATKFRGKAETWTPTTPTKGAEVTEVRTRYLTPEQQQDHEVKAGEPVDEAGGAKHNRLLDAKGNLLDTTAASGIGHQGSQGKHIFTMNPQGAIRAADPASLMREEAPKRSILDDLDSYDSDSYSGGGRADAAPKVRLAMANHSSLAAIPHYMEKVSPDHKGELMDGKVAGAGELTVAQGKLQEVSDQSGHYKPDSTMTGQVLDRLGGMGLDMHDTSVKLGAKDLPGMAPSETERPLIASAREFAQVTRQMDKARTKDGAVFDDYEQERAMRTGRMQMSSAVSKAAAARQDRAESGNLKLRDLPAPIEGKTGPVENPTVGNDWWKGEFLADQADDRKSFTQGAPGINEALGLGENAAAKEWDQKTAAPWGKADTGVEERADRFALPANLLKAKQSNPATAFTMDGHGKAPAQFDTWSDDKRTESAETLRNGGPLPKPVAPVDTPPVADVQPATNAAAPVEQPGAGYAAFPNAGAYGAPGQLAAMLDQDDDLSSDEPQHQQAAPVQQPGAGYAAFPNAGAYGAPGQLAAMFDHDDDLSSDEPQHQQAAPVQQPGAGYAAFPNAGAYGAPGQLAAMFDHDDDLSSDEPQHNIPQPGPGYAAFPNTTGYSAPGQLSAMFGHDDDLSSDDPQHNIPRPGPGYAAFPNTTGYSAPGQLAAMFSHDDDLSSDEPQHHQAAPVQQPGAGYAALGSNLTGYLAPTGFSGYAAPNHLAGFGDDDADLSSAAPLHHPAAANTAAPKTQPAVVQPEEDYAGADGKWVKRQNGSGWGRAKVEALPEAAAGASEAAAKSDLPLALRDRDDYDGTSYETKKMGDAYLGEQKDASAFRGLGGWSQLADTANAKVDEVKTNYLDPVQQQQHEVKGGSDGLIRNAKGELADTSAAKGVGLSDLAGDAGKHIFVMNKSGTMRAADSWAGHTEEKIEGGPEGSTRMGFMNHSSLAAQLPGYVSGDREMDRTLQAGEVAGAGELKMEQGKLQQITDASGHYKPESKLTGQVIDQLAGDGVDLHDTALKLTGTANRPLHASVREFQAERGAKNVPAWQKPEQRMLDRREQNRTEIAAAVAGRDERAANGELKMRDLPNGEQPAASGDAAVMGNDWWKSAFLADQAEDRKGFTQGSPGLNEARGLGENAAAQAWDHTSAGPWGAADTESDTRASRFALPPEAVQARLANPSAAVRGSDGKAKASASFDTRSKDDQVAAADELRNAGPLPKPDVTPTEAASSTPTVSPPTAAKAGPHEESSWLGDAWGSVTAGAGHLWNEASGAVSSLAGSVGEGLSSMGSAIGSGVTSAIDWAAGGLSSLWGDGDKKSDAGGAKKGGASAAASELFDGYF